MKTKAICILLFTFLVCVRLSAHACICPIDSYQKKSIEENHSIYKCEDCGHTQNCCIEQQDLEVSLDNQSAFKLIEACVLESQPQIANVFFWLPQQSAFFIFANKAPPDLSPSTPVSLHQKILV